jgi:hypothetical protein
MDAGVVALMIPIVALLCGAAVTIARMWSTRPRPADGVEAPARLEAVEAELTALRQELTETQERLDFAERLLAQGPDATRRLEPRPPAR